MNVLHETQVMYIKGLSQTAYISLIYLKIHQVLVLVDRIYIQLTTKIQTDK